MIHKYTESILKSTSFIDNTNKISETKIKKSKNLNELKEVAEKFEAIFVNMMLKEMRKNIHKSDFLKGGFVEELFEDMLYQEYSNIIAKQYPLGLAEKIVETYKDYIK